MTDARDYSHLRRRLSPQPGMFDQMSEGAKARTEELIALYRPAFNPGLEHARSLAERAAVDHAFEQAAESAAYVAAADDFEGEDADLYRSLVLPELAAIRFVVDQRRRLRANGSVKPTRSQASVDLDRVKDAVRAIPISDVLEREFPSIEVFRGRNGEHHSGCPFCSGGHDRLVIRDSWDPPLAWCRQCRTRADSLSIAAYAWRMDLLTAAGFRETVLRLADEYLGGMRGAA